MNQFVIAFNGPPHSGKDTIANELAKQITGSFTRRVERVALSLPMRLATCALLGIEYTPESYERDKDKVFPLTGETFRQTMIRLSEEFVKPTYGHGYRCAAAMQAVQSNTRIVILSDLGFPVESDYFQRICGDKFLTVQLEREGTDWSKDSREYTTGQNLLRLANNAGVQWAAAEVRKHLVGKLAWPLAALATLR